jgi:folate-binding protein YgfZ
MTTLLAPPAGVRLPHLGLMRARGKDAATFLQGQLTNDVSGLGADQFRLAGFCSAKGRMQASFLVWRVDAEDFLLACPADVLASTLKRLSMFVMRAQCRLSDASDELALVGLLGADARAACGDLPAWGRRETGAGTLLRLPDAGELARCVVVVPTALTAAATADAAALSEWRLAEVRCGIALIVPATVDRFVPQMVNFELVGGVDFAKGCYPGQEVVARSQYRGTLKRRMFLFECDAPARAGDEVFHDADPGQPAGLVVDATALRTGGTAALLVEVKLAALEGGTLHLGSVGGAVLHQRPLPYPVPQDAPAAA